MATQSHRNFGEAPRSALQFVLWFGAVSLFADMAYEGARSVVGPFLQAMGATGLIVGAVSGFGEFLGYGFRLVSGSWADRSRLYWPITLGGYIIQMVSVPLLALAGTWPHAAVLVLLERTGRAARNPPRDVMLAHAGEGMGRGWAFGINEALDQLGALAGPLAIAGMIAWFHDFRTAFAMLALPAAIALLLVFGARVRFADAGRIEREPEGSADGRYPREFWVYCAGGALVGLGFAGYSLIAYHLSKAQIVAHVWIPVLYALAMGAAGLGSLALGKLFDRFGLIVLVPVTLIVAAYAPLAFLGDFNVVLVGIVLWGIGLGAHESVMQAAVARMVPQGRLGSAYGVFGTIFGIGWFAGSAAMGALYDVAPMAAALFGVAAEVVAVVPLLQAARLTRR
jgi:MFS family permease